MSNKQDRQGVRTAPELERKYDFKGSFQKVRDSIRTVGKAAQQAQKSAEQAEEYARSQILQLSNSIKLEVTNDTTGKKAVIKLSVPVGESGETAEYTGTIDLTGMVTFTNLEEEGATVINGSNIKTGSIIANLIKGGILSSLDGKMKLDLGSGTLAFYDENGNFLGNFADQGGGGFALYLQDIAGTYGVNITADGYGAHVGVGSSESSHAYMTYENGQSTVSGDVVIAKAQPVAETHAVNKKYVDANFVPTSRKVNGKALSSDITLSASDVGARPSTWTPSASDVGMPDVNTWLNNAGLVKTITVGGDANTYYPVVIHLSRDKIMPTYVSISKDLGSTTPGYDGNHPSGTSSMWLIYEGRYNGWDGNGGYVKTLYRSMPYANLCAAAGRLTKANGDLVVWLRGGGCEYHVSTTNVGTVDIYYQSTNLGTSEYPDTIAPTTTVTNRGLFSTVPLGYGNIEGTASGNALANHTHTADDVGAISSVYANSYYGMGLPSGVTDWIRTTKNGIIPYQSGGHSALGTVNWPFSSAYATNFYGTFNGNASSATQLTTSAGSSSVPVYFSGGKPVACSFSLPTDYVTESSSKSITLSGHGVFTWFWRIWASGRKECEGFYSTTVNITSAWGNQYESAQLPNVPYPFTFSQTPAQHVSAISDSGMYLQTVGGYSSSTTQTCGVCLMRPTAASSLPVRVFYRAYGV